MIPLENFDFLLGHWKVHNCRLKERLCSCTEWIEFTAHMETKKILNGLALMDEMKTDYFGETFIGLSIRMVDPATNEWTIYWADTLSPENKIKEQVSGKFENGIGLFYGKENYKGQEVKLRFLWKKDSKETAQWEQAYFDEKEKAWETNWVMIFSPIA
jgi:hypothetical protein